MKLFVGLLCAILCGPSVAQPQPSASPSSTLGSAQPQPSASPSSTLGSAQPQPSASPSSTLGSAQPQPSASPSQSIGVAPTPTLNPDGERGGFVYMLSAGKAWYETGRCGSPEEFGRPINMGVSCGAYFLPNLEAVLKAYCNLDNGGGTVTNYASLADCEDDNGFTQNFKNGDCLTFSATDGTSAELNIMVECRTPGPRSPLPPTSAPPMCFADDAQVNLIDGSVRPLGHVQVGDMVQSYDQLGRSTFSEVFLVQHTDTTKRVAMRRIEFSAAHGAGWITVSGEHYLDAGANGHVMRADELAVGDGIYVMGRDGSRTKAWVQEVSTVLATPRNVHTMNDRLVVNGVLATPFTEVKIVGVNSMRLRVLLLPLKILYLMGFSRLVQVLDKLANSAVLAARPISLAQQ